MQLFPVLKWILLFSIIMTLLCFARFLYTDCTQKASQLTLKTSYESRKSQSIQNLVSYPVSNKSACACQLRKGFGVQQLQTFVPEDDLRSAVERRKKEYEHYKKREQTDNIPLIIAPSNSPLRYPIHGVQVKPLSTILLPGLQIDVSLPKYTVALEASLGTFDIQVNTSETRSSVIQINGRGEKRLEMITSDISVINRILGKTTYTSTVYSIDSLDIVKFSMNQYLANIPVSIRQPPIARLHDPGRDGNISSLVTIATKTFLRYDMLRKLIKSIRLYYPDIKVIVADDNDELEKIEDPNVEQYFMPFAKGWFAGRNLAVSQVTTKYFLWVDDDFLFTEETKIEKLVDVLEGTDLDVVGGNVAGNHFSITLLLEEGDDKGDCLHWEKGAYHQIEGFPNCVLCSGVVNFFLAHTERVLGVGFDPKLNRVAHTEFFIDGLGRLRVGSCDHVIIDHPKKIKPTEEKQYKLFRKYQSFRKSKNFEEHRAKLELLHFKSRLSCFIKKKTPK
ncbi:beta-1,4 N-acetylgalactosaminyltransferase 2-like isoform X1 [Rana temporaria]|uniref:beta-1,4 N-acetylgalactosaminyltransferase 2-like isoform X1 n=1 Tax=Rana temporaria TaxID=8407 RepID=UPI001AAD46BE|nr:beta-1,4 N-acetylgalactosaminyltransferase 2-like isoform X1 [Rana temporaria]